jgi:hypothetical protein
MVSFLLNDHLSYLLVQSLVSSILVQDKAVTKIQLTDTEGIKISGSTETSELVSQPFQLRINDTVLDVIPQQKGRSQPIIHFNNIIIYISIFQGTDSSYSKE